MNGIQNISKSVQYKGWQDSAKSASIIPNWFLTRPAITNRIINLFPNNTPPLVKTCAKVAYGYFTGIFCAKVMADLAILAGDTGESKLTYNFSFGLIGIINVYSTGETL